MFVQVIQGRVADPQGLRESMNRWVRDLAPSAPGWLGTTAGITDDGYFIALARFESQEAARRNSDRPEQDRWWIETEKLFAGEVTFRDSTDVMIDLPGNPDQAGFVQVVRGRVSDPGRARELMAAEPDKWAAFRPEVLGNVVVGHEGGDYTMAAYFTSESAAREGERKQPPAELAAQMEQMNELSIGEPEYFDLTEPWLYSR